MRTILKIVTLSIAVGSGVMSIRKHDTIKEYQDSPDSGAGIREVCLCVFYKFLVNDCPGLNSLRAACKPVGMGLFRPSELG